MLHNSSFSFSVRRPAVGSSGWLDVWLRNIVAVMNKAFYRAYEKHEEHNQGNLDGDKEPPREVKISSPPKQKTRKESVANKRISETA